MLGTGYFFLISDHNFTFYNNVLAITCKKEFSMRMIKFSHADMVNKDTNQATALHWSIISIYKDIAYPTLKLLPKK